LYAQQLLSGSFTKQRFFKNFPDYIQKKEKQKTSKPHIRKFQNGRTLINKTRPIISNFEFANMWTHVKKTPNSHQIKISSSSLREFQNQHHATRSSSWILCFGKINFDIMILWKDQISGLLKRGRKHAKRSIKKERKYKPSLYGLKLVLPFEAELRQIVPWNYFPPSSRIDSGAKTCRITEKQTQRTTNTTREREREREIWWWLLGLIILFLFWRFYLFLGVQELELEWMIGRSM
jgi:hypothetical protein